LSAPRIITPISFASLPEGAAAVDEEARECDRSGDSRNNNSNESMSKLSPPPGTLRVLFIYSVQTVLFHNCLGSLPTTFTAPRPIWLAGHFLYWQGCFVAIVIFYGKDKEDEEEIETSKSNI